MSNTKRLGRRHFLQVMGAATACVSAGGMAGCGAGGNTQSTSAFLAGTVASYTAPIWKLFASNDMIVALDSNGFYAYSDICTHAGCFIVFTTPADTAGDSSADGSTNCPCHHSSFDGEGAVVQGPARTALPHFQVTIANGQVSVDPGIAVDASVRVTG